ncbi:DMP19 family protein [Croceivirga radicis]|uniref:DMP19 family protein n=1 Tax=Croceivirga radicis TaxID=1929488 RepID=UPI000255B55C|nr:DUF4375 domain-containing protein [Croceivirga radicis]
MKLTILIAILVGFKYLVPYLVKFGEPKKSKNKSEWELKVKFAKLNQQLFETADNEEKEELLYYFTHKIRQTDNYDEASFKTMPKVLQIVYLVNELNSEINNGGYLRFFTNSSGQYVKETLDALALIGAEHNKYLLEKALEVLTKFSLSPENLNEKLYSKVIYETFSSSDFYENDELLEEMNKLDTEFYANKENLSKLKLDYIESNRDELWLEIQKKYSY